MGPWSRPKLPRISTLSGAKIVLKELLEGVVDFGEIKRLVTGSSPKLLVGAVEVRSGEFEVFRDAEVTVEKILASCALPLLFRAVQIGEDGVYWDGLFSQNPPIRDFMREFPNARAKPDEIWLIQINPQRREHMPTKMADILDRRNELAGNLSLHQEIDFIHEINGLLSYLPKDRYKYIEVRKIEMLRELDAISKTRSQPLFHSRDGYLRRGAGRGVLGRSGVAASYSPHCRDEVFSETERTKREGRRKDDWAWVMPSPHRLGLAQRLCGYTRPGPIPLPDRGKAPSIHPIA